MMGLKAEEMDGLRPGRIEVPRLWKESVEIPWSDHLRAEMYIYHLKAVKQLCAGFLDVPVKRFYAYRH
jgi:hypothetical protein